MPSDRPLPGRSSEIERRSKEPKVGGSNPSGCAKSPATLNRAPGTTDQLSSGDRQAPTPRSTDPTSAGIESRLRAVVVDGLEPLLLDVLAGAETSPLHARALARLGLLDRRGRATALAADVAHQCAALKVAGELPAFMPELAPELAFWAHPLFDGASLSPYGRHLLAFLRMGSLLHRCQHTSQEHGCEGAVVGVALRGGVRVLACAEHRCAAADLSMGALDRRLASVGEVGHG